MRKGSSRKGSSKLSAKDLLAIEQLNARFAQAFDMILPDPAAAWAGTFSPTGDFTLLDAGGHVQAKAHGTRELKALHGQLARPTSRHWYTNLLIEPDRGGRARMRCYFISLDTATRSLVRTATYSDTLVKLRGQWKFKSRTVTLDAGSS